MTALSKAPTSATSTTDPIPSRESSGWPTAWLAIGVFSLMSITLAIISQGFLEGDACSHYLAARAAFANPAYLVSVWNRPFCTGLYMLPAHFGGRLAVRFTSLAVAIVIAIITRSVAVGQGWKWPTLALLFLLAQPLVFLHSFAELTELPFALLIALGFRAYQRRRFFWFALVIGIGPLSRPEGFGFAGLAFMALVLHRRWYWSVILALPVLLWDLAGWKIFGCQGPWWQWLINNWPWGKESVYEPGPIWHFVRYMPAVVSPFIFPATVVGVGLCFGSANVRRLVREAASGNHIRRCEILIAVLPLIILIGHSLLYWRGKMASNGELRYMMVVAPFWALLSARGWSWIFSQTGWRRPLLWASFAAMLPVLVTRAWTVVPMNNSQDWIEAQQIAAWYKTTQQQKYPHLFISHVGLQYALDIDPDSGQILDWKKSNIDIRPKGTMLIWDRIGALYNSDANRKVPLDEIQAAGWKLENTRWTQGAGEWEFFVSEP